MVKLANKYRNLTKKTNKYKMHSNIFRSNILLDMY